MLPVIMKPAVDTKGDDAVISRLGVSRKVDIQLGAKDSALTALERHPNASCILVDEAQFLQPNQVDELFWYATKQNIPVIAYGLRTDFQTKGFPGATRLLELAHDLQELKTICRCGKKAMLNARKSGEDFIFIGGQIAIDGEKDITYESLCATCYDMFKTAAA